VTKVVFTPAAEREVDRLHTWISDRAGESVADAFILRIVAYCQGFSTFSERGRDDLLPGLRTIGFERRVTIAFIIDRDVVSIEGGFYRGRDIETSFARER
jgi:toxin ParE1/3/4